MRFAPSLGSVFAPNAAVVLAVLLLSLPAADSLAAEDWRGFRGTNGSGVSSSTGVPIELAPDKNLIWESEVPFGRSSPVVVGDTVYLTAVDGGKLVTLALDRESGKNLWRAELAPSVAAEFHTATDSATPTPVADQGNVYSFFHEFGLVSYDASGQERWKRPLGPFRNFYGIAASPVLSGELVYQLCDQAEGSFIVAVDKNSGEQVWRTTRSARFEAYSTPLLYPNADDPKLLIVSSSRWVDAYDPRTGALVWSHPGVGASPVSSPILEGDVLYVSAIDHAEDGWTKFESLIEEHDKDGDGELSRSDVADAWVANHFGWLNADGEGNITEADWTKVGREMVSANWGVYALRLAPPPAKPEVLWNYRKNVPYIPSPVISGDVFFMIKDGVVTSLDPATGELHKRDRLGKSSAKVYASPVAADGRLYVGTMAGEMIVLDAAAEWQVLATNEVGEEIWASPAVADGRLYVRTKDKLLTFGARSVGTGEDDEEPIEPAELETSSGD